MRSGSCRPSASSSQFARLCLVFSFLPDCSACLRTKKGNVDVARLEDLARFNGAPVVRLADLRHGYELEEPEMIGNDVYRTCNVVAPHPVTLQPGVWPIGKVFNGEDLVRLSMNKSHKVYAIVYPNGTMYKMVKGKLVVVGPGPALN